VAATTSSTSSGGNALVNAPTDTRSGSQPSGDTPSDPSCATGGRSQSPITDHAASSACHAKITLTQGHCAWGEFIPFLDYPAELRRVVYTTNAIESINFQLRKITKTRGHFPSDEAAMKLLYLGLRNISSNRGGESGTGTHGWKTALNTLVVLFPGRLPL